MRKRKKAKNEKFVWIHQKSIEAKLMKKNSVEWTIPWLSHLLCLLQAIDLMCWPMPEPMQKWQRKKNGSRRNCGWYIAESQITLQSQSTQRIRWPVSLHLFTLFYRHYRRSIRASLPSSLACRCYYSLCDDISCIIYVDHRLTVT